MRLLWFVYIMTSWGPLVKKVCYFSSIRLKCGFRHCWPWPIADGFELTHWYNRGSPELVWVLLKGRTQHVVIINVKSSMTKLKCGVPHGSVLGPVLFTTYLLPLSDILRKFGVQFHCYADDTHLYIPFSQNDHSCLGSIEECISVIQIWMKANFLKLNAEKTEMIILSSPFLPRHGHMTWLLT